MQEVNFGYKLLRGSKIAKLQILGVHNENRSNIDCIKYKKHRCSKALVLDIWDYCTSVKYSSGLSMHDNSFEYNVDKIVEPRQFPFDDNLDVECTSGIHYFKTIEAAIGYDDHQHLVAKQFSGKMCEHIYARDNYHWEILTFKNGKLIATDKEYYKDNKLIRKKSYINICDNIRDVEYRKTYERTYNKHGRLIKTIKYTYIRKKQNIKRE